MEIINKICEKTREIAKEKGRCIIAIDGRCGSGKSTLAALLAEKLSAQTVYLDDFFLPFEVRTPGRMAEAGGNIHYERFTHEVISNLDKESFDYGVFDCSVMKINGTSHIENSGIIIFEGSYALHDKFGKYYDIAIFSDVSYDTQVERIRKRNGEEMLKRFVSEWIPMEEKYFAAQKTKEKCDFIINQEG